MRGAHRCNPCTRPFRAMSELADSCGWLVGFVVLSFMAIAMILPLMRYHGATWIATVCEFTAPMTLQRSGSRIPRIRVDAPVTVFEPSNFDGKTREINGRTWAGVAHHWPPHTMFDTSRQTVYKWWLGIGGTGMVLEEPTEGDAYSGQFDFTTPIGKRVQCWYLLGTKGAPSSIKLSNEAIPWWQFYLAGAMLAVLALLTLAGACYYGAPSFEQCTNKWERLEGEDEEEVAEVAAEIASKAARTEARTEAAKPKEQRHVDDARRRMLKRVDSRAGKLVGARAIHRSNSHFFADPSEWYKGNHDTATRNGFLRKVYGVILLQIILTAAVAMLFMYYEPVADFFFGTMGVWYGILLGILAGFLVAFKNEYPLNYLSLLAFTLCVAVIVGLVCSTFRSSGQGDLVLQGFVYNGFLFGCLTLWTMQSCIRFHFLVVPLSISLLLVIFAGFIGRVLHSSVLTTVYACCGPLVFMGYIVFDTYMITQRFGYDDNIVAVMEVYTDMFYSFVYILFMIKHCGNPPDWFLNGGGSPFKRKEEELAKRRAAQALQA